MKTAIKIIIAIILVAAIGFGGFIGFQSSKGISYDIASVEKLQSNIEIVSETDDSVTIKKKSDGDYKVVMFTDTHLKGDKELDNMTVTYLVENIKVGGTRTYTARTQYGNTVISADTARVVTEYMRNNVQNQYGDHNFPGLAVCAKTGTAEVGGDKKPNAMLAGFVADRNYPLAFIVCVEDGGYGAQVCLPIASQVLQACVEVMESGG